MLRPAIELAAAAAAAAAFHQTAATPVFAPPLDRPIRFVTERVQDNGSEVRRFRVERRLVFRRRGDGYLAESTVILVKGSDGAAGTMFETGLAGLVGTTIRYDLDSLGRVDAIRDQAKVWDALVRGITHQATVGDGGGAAERRVLANRMTMALELLPPERRRVMLASMLTSVVAPEKAAARPEREAPATLRPRSPYASTEPIAGVRTIAVENGLVSIRIEAQGPVAAPSLAGAKESGAARMRIAVEERIDRATGLLLHSVERVETRLGGNSEAGHQIDTTTMSISW